MLPLIIEEPASNQVRDCFQGGPHAIWWATPLECESALCRRLRESGLTTSQANDIRHDLEILRRGMVEILPTEEVRKISLELLRVHPLRAADAAQLGAAEMWRRRSNQVIRFICLDQRLRQAALTQGFSVGPSLGQA